MRVTAIVPAYNESETVGLVVATLQQVPLIDEIIVVNDGSQDDTAGVAMSSGARLVDLEHNCGKGAAMAEGARQAHGELLIFLDADLNGLQAEHVCSMLEPVFRGEADMTIGIFSDGRPMTDWAQVVAPYISGQRVISRELFLAAGTESCRFEVEVLISRFARQHHLRVQKVLLPNMTHVMKEEKRGVTRGLVERVGMYKDITYFMMRPHRSRHRALRPAYVGFIMFIGLALLSYNLSYVKTARAEAGRLLHLTIGNQTKRILVISTHPDDEALAAGGLIAQAVQSRNQVKVVYLTNGDGFRNGLELFKKKLYLQPQDFLNYGRERMGEAVAAMGQLGLSRDQVVFLGYPDGGLEKIRQGYRADKAYLAPRTKVSAVPYSDALSPGAAYNTASVLSDLQTVMRDYQPTEIILPNPEDSHPDHRAAGLLTLEAVTAWLKAAPDPDLQLYSYLIHSGLWQVVPSIRKNDLLLPPKRFMERGMDWYNLPMTLESLKQKRLALDQYKSQKKVMASFFANFLRPNEVFCEIRLSDLARFQQSIPAEDQLPVLQFSNNNVTNLKIKFFHQGQGGYLPSEADNWASVFPIEQSPLQLVSSNGGL